MIVTVTPNPTMDQVYVMSEFRPSRRLRAKSSSRHPGGKGVNVSVVLSQLGFESVATGFLAGHTGSFIRDELLACGVSTNFVSIKGENRTTTFIRDGEYGTETVVTDVGPDVPGDAQKRFFWKLDRLLHRVSAIHMGGSLPPGVRDDLYFQITDRARAYNIPVFLDAYGDPLERALEALPTVVKLDHRQFNSFRSVTQSALDHLIETSKRIYDEGVDWVVSSYFNRTNVFCTTKGFYLAEITQEGLRSYRSADDALMAGMIAARSERMGIEDTIRFAMACVLQTARWEGTGLPNRVAVERSLGEISIQKL